MPTATVTPDAEAPADTQAASAPDTKLKKPVTFWLAGPDKMAQQVRIHRPGSRRMLRFSNGRLTVQTQDEYDLVKRVMKGRAWEETIGAKEDTVVCAQCGYAPRSYAAFNAHQQLHPVFPRE